MKLNHRRPVVLALAGVAAFAYRTAAQDSAAAPS
jgi:hypothetical protein